MSWITIHAARMNGTKVDFYRRSIDIETIAGWSDHLIESAHSGDISCKETFDQISLLIDEAKTEDTIRGE